ncbi:hypothetical protein Tco_0933164 [Tanacetum coccineum]
MSSLASFLLWLRVFADLLPSEHRSADWASSTGWFVSFKPLLENTLAVYGRRVPLDAVTRLCISSWASSFYRMTLILRAVSASFDASDGIK